MNTWTFCLTVIIVMLVAGLIITSERVDNLTDRLDLMGDRVWEVQKKVDWKPDSVQVRSLLDEETVLRVFYYSREKQRCLEKANVLFDDYLLYCDSIDYFYNLLENDKE